jgi:hypothetical protein
VAARRRPCGAAALGHSGRRRVAPQGARLAACHRAAPPIAGSLFRSASASLRSGSRALGSSLPGSPANLLAAPVWTGPALWLHGDLHPANLLTRDGNFCGVVDFGDLCAGDPACDLAACWMLLPDRVIDRFHQSYSPAADAATRRRARGWALWKALACVLIGDAGVHGRPGGKATWGSASARGPATTHRDSSATIKGFPARRLNQRRVSPVSARLASVVAFRPRSAREGGRDALQSPRGYLEAGRGDRHRGDDAGRRGT